MKKNIIKLIALVACFSGIVSCGRRDNSGEGSSVATSTPSTPADSTPTSTPNSTPNQSTSSEESTESGGNEGNQLFTTVDDVMGALDALKTKDVKSMTLTQAKALVTKSNPSDKPTGNSIKVDANSKEVLVTNATTNKVSSYKGLVGDTYYDISFDAQGSAESGSRKKVLESAGDAELETDQILKTDADAEITKSLSYVSLDGFISGKYDINTNVTFGGIEKVFPGTAEEGKADPVELTPLSVTKNSYGITTVSYSSYKEEANNNYRYAITLRFNDQKSLLSNSFIEYYKANDDSAWDKTNHEPYKTGDNVNYWHFKETLNEVDFSARAETGTKPIIEDKLTNAFITKINDGGLVFYPSDNMGELDTTKPNELTQGWDVTIAENNFVKNKIQPQTAIDLDSVRIISSSDTNVISNGQWGWTASGAGETDLTVGNSFNANLGVVHVKVTGDGGSETTGGITYVSDEMGNTLYSSDGTGSGFTTSLQPDATANQHFWSITVGEMATNADDLTLTLDDPSLIDASKTEISANGGVIEISLEVIKAGTTTATLTYKNNDPVTFPFTVTEAAASSATISRISTASGTPVYTSATTLGFSTTVGSTAESNVLTVNVEGELSDLSGFIVMSNSEDVASIAVVEGSLDGTVNPTFKLQVTPKKAGTTNISMALSEEQVSEGTIVSFDITVK